MSLREKINKQFNTALKSRDKTLVSTLRLIMAAIKDKDIANRSGEKKNESKDQEIILVCGAGGMAALTGKTMIEMGYKNVKNVGGIGDWIKAEGPMEK